MPSLKLGRPPPRSPALPKRSETRKARRHSPSTSRSQALSAAAALPRPTHVAAAHTFHRCSFTPNAAASHVTIGPGRTRAAGVRLRLPSASAQHSVQVAGLPQAAALEVESAASAELG